MRGGKAITFISLLLLLGALLPAAAQASVFSDLIALFSGTAEAKVESEAQVQLNTVYFPGWELKINGRMEDIKSNLSQGVPRVVLSPGNNEVELFYKETQLMQLADAISIIASVILIVLFRKNLLQYQKAPCS